MTDFIVINCLNNTPTCFDPYLNDVGRGIRMGIEVLPFFWKYDECLVFERARPHSRPWKKKAYEASLYLSHLLRYGAPEHCRQTEDALIAEDYGRRLKHYHSLPLPTPKYLKYACILFDSHKSCFYFTPPHPSKPEAVWRREKCVVCHDETAVLWSKPPCLHDICLECDRIMARRFGEGYPCPYCRAPVRFVKKSDE